MCLPLGALDVREGTVRVKADEINGRITLYGLDMKSSARYEALLFETDARTSFLTVSIDGRYARLGEDQEFRTNVRKIEKGLEIEYRSFLYAVSQKIEFIRSSDSRVSDGFKISYTLKNSSTRDSKMGIKQILDTRLGEKSGTHFVVDGFDKSDEEKVFSAADLPRFISSPGETSSLTLLLDNLPRPDIVVLANWKRLADSSWAYTSPMRGYSLVPYSVNDSAMGLYWNDTIVKAGASVTFSCYFLHGLGGLEFVKRLKEGKIQVEGFSKPIAAVAVPEKSKDTALRIEELQRLLEAIDQTILGLETAEDGGVEALRAALEELKQLSALEQP
jgi:hypothetical protein